MSFWSDLLDVISSASGNEGAVTAPSSNVGPDLATKTAAGQFLTLTEGIWTEIADGKLWRSVWWLVLGVVLMLLGVLWWLGPSSELSTAGPARAVKRLLLCRRGKPRSPTVRAAATGAPAGARAAGSMPPRGPRRPR